MRPLVKICGITRLQDARLAVDLGASALGFIFYPKSLRFVTPADAGKILRELGPGEFWRVGVFVNPSLTDLENALATAPLTHIQLHGNETPDFCRQVRLKFPALQVIKAIRLGTGETEIDYPVVFALIDHASSGEWGGTGVSVSWSEVAQLKKLAFYAEKSLFLAGGLNAQNVQTAIEEISPDGIDLSSGVEDAPGIKSELKLRAFFAALAEINKLETS